MSVCLLSCGIHFDLYPFSDTYRSCVDDRIHGRGFRAFEWDAVDIDFQVKNSAQNHYRSHLGTDRVFLGTRGALATIRTTLCALACF